MTHPLIEAVKSHQSIEAICELVSAHLLEKDDERRTALMWAILSDYPEAAEILTSEAGRFDAHGKCAYIYAFERGMLGVMEAIKNDREDELEMKMPDDSGLSVWQYVQLRQREDVLTHVEEPPAPESDTLNLFSNSPFGFIPKSAENVFESPPGLGVGTLTGEGPQSHIESLPYPAL